MNKPEKKMVIFCNLIPLEIKLKDFPKLKAATTTKKTLTVLKMHLIIFTFFFVKGLLRECIYLNPFSAQNFLNRKTLFITKSLLLFQKGTLTQCLIK